MKPVSKEGHMHFNSFEEYLTYIQQKDKAEVRELKEAKPKRKGKKKDESVQTD